MFCGSPGEFSLASISARLIDFDRFFRGDTDFIFHIVGVPMTRSGHTNFLCYFVSSEYFADEAGLGRREDEAVWVWKLEMTGVE